eukprot:XP_011672251.1 PREDICTED: LOW QUALITY PROTEIN: kinesin-like protein KIF21A [Strongylocentrotus purpuratus]
MPEKQDDTSVRVAVRIRPQLAREKIDACRVCTAVSPDEPQIILGPDRMFTYDNVFDMDSQQDSLYQKTVHDLIEGCFEGYNATVFAYGQTGSGKTYSMGTGFEPGLKEDQKGIIPRAVRHLFTGIEERRRSATERSEPPPEFKIYAEFMELYNEEVLDLFDTTRDMESSRHKKSHIKIHEDAGGGIYVVGVTTRTVTSEPETLQALQGGALSRTTASTKMNSQSSRSHAIFTLHIKQQRLIKVTTEIEGEGEKEAEKAEGDGMNEFEMLTAKFHFVDLAGSERLKRTGATGDRAKEGISINCGLLALGNVISALGDPTKRSSHVPYRDSKLTRLLQDSLGGNSRTLMIACVSPSDPGLYGAFDHTLRYANRARNIRTAVIANQDKTRVVSWLLLGTEIKRLQDDSMNINMGKRSVNSEGVEEINDLFHENTLLQMENGNLRLRIKALQETIDGLTARVALLVAEQARYGMSASTDRSCYTMPADLGDLISVTIVTYLCMFLVIFLLPTLVESESMNSALRRKNVDSPVRVNSRASMMNPSHGALRPSSAIFTAPIFENEHYGDEGVRVASVLSDAKKQVEADQEKIRQVEKRRDSHGGSEKDMESCEEVTDESHESVQDHETEGTKEERGEEDEEEKEEEDADDEDDDDKDSSSSSDSESDEEENAQLQENLAELACEITIKQRLIEELEHSQKRLHTMKMQYEEKLGSLLDKIKETESERDKVLDNLGSMAESRTKDKAEKIRKEFEIKLKKLSEEKDRLTKVQKEHNKILKSKSQFERQMKGLKDEVFKMKETKVKLMKQIREEQQKGRNKDQLSSREIQRLKKESRKKETQIKTLEASAKQRELILKRKHEQLEMLRKNQKPMSDKVAGRLSRPVKKPSTAPSTAPAETGQRVLSRRGKAKVDTGRPSKHERKGTSEYSSKTARQKWNKMERKITDIIARRQTISYMERDMERFIHHRHKLSKKVEKYLTKRDEALKAGNKDPSVQKDLDEQIDGLNDNMEYVQEQITECQSGIMEVMEGKEEIDAVDAAAVIEQCSLREAKYMLEHFINLAINKGLSAAQKESQVKELEAKLHQEEQNSFVQQTLLQHMMKEREGEDLDLDGLFSNSNLDSESSSNSSRAPSPVDIRPVLFGIACFVALVVFVYELCQDIVKRAKQKKKKK